MSLLYINACYRDGSRTARLAQHYLAKYKGTVEEVTIGDMEACVLDRERLAAYCDAVASWNYQDPMFDFAKQFSKAEEILIAAPFWNFSIPAALHAYLEMVCTQGITFDLQEDGSYGSMCRAKKLTYVTTAGGYIPEHDHAFGYIKDLAEIFWNIPEIEYHKADGIDILGVDVEAELNKAMN